MSEKSIKEIIEEMRKLRKIMRTKYARNTSPRYNSYVKSLLKELLPYIENLESLVLIMLLEEKEETG